MSVQHLLRKSAIERMSSPEQLDMAMRVTSPVSWIALVTLGVVILAAIAFSIFGRIPVKVDGTGILLRGEIQTIQITAAGTVESIEVETGEVVHEGQVVAHVRLPDLDSEIRSTQERISDFESQGTVASGDFSRLRSDYQRQVNELERRRKGIQSLIEKGIKTRNDLASIDAQISSVRAQLRQAQGTEVERENRLAEERRKLRQLEDQYERNSVVRSPYAGRIAAIMKPAGQVIQPGERLMNLEDPDAPFHALLFVPFSEGKNVRVGMPIRISPSTVKPEEFGFIVGSVDTISAQAVTPEEVRTALSNDQLAQKFAKDTPFRVSASPHLDDETQSGFEWTSSKGPPFNITGNTPCSAQIIIKKRRPISYVIPTMKKAFVGG